MREWNLNPLLCNTDALLKIKVESRLKSTVKGCLKCYFDAWTLQIFYVKYIFMSYINSVWHKVMQHRAEQLFPNHGTTWIISYTDRLKESRNAIWWKRIKSFIPMHSTNHPTKYHKTTIIVTNKCGTRWQQYRIMTLVFCMNQNTCNYITCISVRRMRYTFILHSMFHINLSQKLKWSDFRNEYCTDKLGVCIILHPFA